MASMGHERPRDVADWHAVFDEDYLHFYEPALGDERSDRDADLIASLLELRPGMSVLDVPCGHGRIANRLAARGCRVVGVDDNRAFLDRARAEAERTGVAVDYVEGDMRDLRFVGRFDRVLNWFTSFGYFDDRTNRRVLEGFAAALRPGGRLLLEQVNRDLLVRRLPPAGEPSVFLTERGDDLMIDRVTFDAAAGFSHTERIVVRGGRVRRTGFSLQVLTAPDVAERLRQAGFRTVAVYGEDGERFRYDSRRLIVVAER